MQGQRVKQKGTFPSIFLGKASSSCTHIQSRLAAASATWEECLWKIKEAKVWGIRDVQSESLLCPKCFPAVLQEWTKMTQIAFDICLGMELKKAHVVEILDASVRKEKIKNTKPFLCYPLTYDTYLS